MHDPPPTGTASGPPAGLDAGLDAAVRTFRTAAWAWLAVVTTLSYASVEQPVVAAAGVVAALAVTVAWWTRVAVGARSALLRSELVVGAGLVAADGWVFDDGRAQSFGGVWPLAGVLAVAARAGGRAGVAAGALLGTARLLGEIAFVRGAWSPTRVLAVASTGVLFALAGWAAGWAADRIRRAETEAARIEARAEVAAELHDGVLQTLAVVQRRSDDGDLVRLARTQEAELRRYLAGPTGPAGRVPLEVLLRDLAADTTGRFGLRVEVAAVPPLPDLVDDDAGALRGAVAECLANTAKHAGVDRAVLFAEAEDGQLVVSVTDDGAGFDPVTTPERGLDGSVRRRVERLGGAFTVESCAGRGTTATIRIPLEGR